MDELTIRNLYTIKGWSTQKIADYFGVSSEAIRKRMKKYNIPRRGVGFPKGQPFTEEHKANMKRSNWMAGRRGEDHPGWKGGGPYYDKDGYELRRIDGKLTRTHRRVYEEATGQKLEPTTHIHHKNEQKTNNEPDNLEALSASEHGKHHWQTGKRDKVAGYWTAENRRKVSERFKKEVPGMTKGNLYNLYIEQGWSMTQIADHLGSNRETVRLKLKEFGIRP